MDTTLVINPGSSSKKYALYRGGRELLRAHFEHTERGYGACVEVNGVRERNEASSLREYAAALPDVLERATAAGIITHTSHITRVGVRVVAPGTFFTKHRLVDHAYLTRLREVRAFAPLHTPHVLDELLACAEALPHTRTIGVSDSAFHVTMPNESRRYSIPRRDIEALDLYRFGYHGVSLMSVVRQLHDDHGPLPHRMVVCHVGSGVSVTALRHGKSVDTTMGFAPTSGLAMGTRAGDLDPAALVYLMRTRGMDADSLERYISEESGLRGMLGNADLRVALDRRARGDQSAIIAINLYVRGIRKAIGAMAAVLGGIDALVLTATAPERNPTVRALICSELEHLGLILDGRTNESLGGRPGIVSAPESIPIHVVHTREMEEIARIAGVF